MGWIKDRYENGSHAEPPQTASSTAALRADQKWTELLNGLEADSEDFSHLGGKASFTKNSDTACRISNPAGGISVVLTADLNSQMIRYTYEPNGENVAVPEGGILTLRTSGNSAQVFSADQQLTSEQARRLILEPLLFPSRSTDIEATGT